ncbi:hypothetical protein OC834_002796 [Tilletia horrida]|nr:hypothetical protein OC834_002796 [Tilletia horrida]
MTAIEKVNDVAATSQNVVLPEIKELREPNFLDVLVPIEQEAVTPKQTGEGTGAGRRTHPFVDALSTAAVRTTTENGAAAYSSTGSATLDAFNSLHDRIMPIELDSLLCAAWKEDAKMALRIIFNARSIPDGKGSKTIFYRCWGWLYRRHPRTALVNLPKLVDPLSEQPLRRKRAKEQETMPVADNKKKDKERKPVVKSHGYWKDLLNILALAVLGQLEDREPAFLNEKRLPWTLPKDSAGRKGSKVPRDLEEQVRDFNYVGKRAREAGLSRKELQSQERFVALERSLASPKCRALYITVARLFADRLLKDVALMEEASRLPACEKKFDLLFQISLAGKWAPTPGLSHDRLTNIATAIASLVRDGIPKHDLPAGIRDGQADALTEARVLRSFYQRWILRELRATLELPEPLMSASRWSNVRYRRVASLAMSRSSHLFFQHDTDRFKDFVRAVEKGKSKISGATLMPHELLAKLIAPLHPANRRQAALGPALEAVLKELEEMQTRVIEAQWNALVDSLREAGTLGDTLAICDVSGSMGYPYSDYGSGNKNEVAPIMPAIALSLIIASLAREPFNGGFITFSERPRFVRLELDSDPLKTSFERTYHSGAGFNTDFRAVFLDLLLPMAQQHGLKREDMVKRIFVFSDMQFDQAHVAGAAPWETTYDAIAKAYAEAGYDVPQLVFWDLAGGKTVEVQANQTGVAMMSGFSPAMVKVFMGEEPEEPEAKAAAEGDEDWEQVGDKKEADAADEFTPLKIMQKALLKKSFDTLTIVD